MKKLIIYALSLFIYSSSFAQTDIRTVVENAKAKLDKVQSYQATGKMKTNVAFLKVPIATIALYFQKPNDLKIKSEKGISFIPKGAVNINMSNLGDTKDFTIIDGGTTMQNDRVLRIAKLLPIKEDDNPVILSTLYIDEAANLIAKAKTTTRDNGTYELFLTYGKYAQYALPDRIIFSFNTKDYKLPKGVTFDFETNDDKAVVSKNVNRRKGVAEITLSNYVINKGVPAGIF